MQAGHLRSNVRKGLIYMFGRKKRSLSDFDEEIQARLDLETEEFKEDGLSEEEARYAARRKFGNVTIARERFYEAGRWLWLDTLLVLLIAVTNVTGLVMARILLREREFAIRHAVGGLQT